MTSVNVWRVRISDTGAGVLNDTYQLVEQEAKPISPHTFISPISDTYNLDDNLTALICETIKADSISELTQNNGVDIEGVVLRDGAIFKNGVELVFGDEYQKNERDDSSSPIILTLEINISPLIFYQELATTTLPAGVYRIMANATVGHNSHLGYVEGRILFDDVSVTDEPASYSPDINTIDQKFKMTLVSYVTTGSAATHSIKLQLGRRTTNGSAIAYSGIIEVWRVS